MCGTSQVNGTYGAGPFVQQYTSTATQTGVAGQYSTTQAGGHAHGTGTTLAGHEGHGHDTILYKLKDNPPNADQFIKGSLGKDAGENFKLEKGPGFKGKKGRNPNGNDQKQNNLTAADANRPAYGIPKTVAGTNDRPNYVMDIQVSIGMGGLEALRPDVLQSLIDQQNAGKGSVWNGVAFLTGLIDQHDGSVTPELEAMRSQIMNTKVGGSGKTLHQWAVNPKDENGTNWARSNHSMTGIKAFLQLEAAGIPTQVANKLANNDDLVSGAGRIDQIAPGRASNNQENTFTGMNAAERKEWAKAAKYAKELNRPDILRILMDSHTMGSHMLTQYGNKGAKSKINKSLGIDPNTPADQRKAMLVNYFLNNEKDPKKGDKPKGDLNAPQPGQTTQQTSAPDAAGSGGSDVAAGGGAGAPDVAAGGGCAHDPTQGAKLIGGGPDMGSIGAILQQLLASLNALIQALGSGVGGVAGGGATQQTPPNTTQQSTPGQAHQYT
jgi:hypothetical protein